MTQATINGNTYSDDGTSARDMLHGGHRTWFLPMVGDVTTVAGVVAGQAAQTAIDAVTAANGAAALKATSTTSLVVGAGTKTITTQSGKQFTVGNYVTISRTSAPTTMMHGVVTSYSGTSLVVESATSAGSGTYTDWTIALSGPQGATGATGTAGDIGYLAKTAAYTITAADKTKLIDCTSGTFTLALQACATLGASWATYIRNSGTGTITLDPNLSETIDGVATYVLYPGHTVLATCNGSVLRIAQDVGPKQVRLPIFSAESSNKTGVSVLEDIAFPTYSTNLAASISSKVTYGNSLFIVNSTDSQGNVSTSPDGITWTLRAMPSSAAWSIGTNGTNKFIATVGAATTVAKSTNGTTWTSGTALPGNAGSKIPIFNGDTCLVAGSSGTQCYISSDNGSTWSAVQTLPGGGTSVYGQIFVINGLFWLIVGAYETTTAYTSSTGLTGSWTARTLPISASYAYTQMASDGKLNISSDTAGVLMHESADGINWTSIGIANITGVQSAGLVINGVRFWASVTFPRSSTVHNGIRVQRTASLPCNASLGNYATNGTVFCFSNISGVSSNNIQRFSSDATVPTAIFEG